MVYIVYILYSPTQNKFYKGQTNNISDRLNRHNSGQVSATRDGKPWELVWKTAKHSRAESMRLERKLKNLSVKKLLIFMDKYSHDIQAPMLYDTILKKFESRF